MKKEVIEQYKRENGNNSFNQKDMTIYLVARVDKVFDMLNSGTGKISENRTKIGSLSKLVYTLIPILTIIFGSIFAILWNIRWTNLGIEDNICKKLDLSKEEERFMGQYNPLQFYCRLRELKIPKDVAKIVMNESYEPLYKGLITLMKCYRGDK